MMGHARCARCRPCRVDRGSDPRVRAVRQHPSQRPSGRDVLVLCGGRSDGRWFVKLTPEGAIDAARAELALRLGRPLADLGLPVPRSIMTRSGALWSRVEGLRLAVFEFVDGAPLPDHE